MAYTYRSVSNPRFENAAGTLILVDVDFYHIGSLGEMTPFTASPEDSELHGREIFAKAIAGDFGVVKPFVEPVLMIEQYNRSIKAQIAELDLKCIRPMAEGNAVLLATLNDQVKVLQAQLK